MVVQHNMSAMNANRMLGVTTSAQSKSTEKLSSGYRINRAADDAAGLAISEKMRGQIRGLDKASSNAQDGISLIQTAEGALTETHSIIQRMRELAVQAANDTSTDDDRTQIQNEIDQLTQEVDRIANTTEFNTKKLLDGSKTGSVSEKAGSIKTEGSFGNSLVSASVTTDGSAKSAITDVIRLEVNSDFKEGQSTKGTQKLSDDMIGKINSLVTAAGPVTLDPLLQEGSGQSITNDGYSANNSTAENIKGAVDATKTALAAAQTAANNSAAAVSSNADAIEKVVDDLMKMSDATKATTGDAFIKDGVTKEDITSALKNYMSALVETGTASGAGVSNETVAAQKDLKSLFNTELADGIKLGKALAGTEEIAGASAVKNASNADGAAITYGTATTSATMASVATDVVTKLTNYVKAVATTAITDKVNSAKVDQLSDVLDTLSNTELTTAIVDYKKAETENTTIAGDVNSTDAKKAESKAKLDAAKDTLDKLNTASSPISVSDLFGNSASADTFSIASKLDDDNNLTINLKNKSGEDTVITIANANQLKAGDTLIISSQEMVESKEAATGADALRLQIGANSGQEMSLGINSMKASALNIVQTTEGKEGASLDLTNQASAAMAVNAYDMAIQKVSTERAKMGAVQNRLEHTISNLDTASENTQTAESRIRDTDMASEMVNYSKNNILSQAGNSMLAQANQSTQGVLSLLQ